MPVEQISRKEITIYHQQEIPEFREFHHDQMDRNPQLHSIHVSHCVSFFTFHLRIRYFDLDTAP